MTLTLGTTTKGYKGVRVPWLGCPHAHTTGSSHRSRFSFVFVTPLLSIFLFNTMNSSLASLGTNLYGLYQEFSGKWCLQSTSPKILDDFLVNPITIIIAIVVGKKKIQQPEVLLNNFQPGMLAHPCDFNTSKVGVGKEKIGSQSGLHNQTLPQNQTLTFHTIENRKWNKNSSSFLLTLVVSSGSLGGRQTVFVPLWLEFCFSC